MSPDAQIDRPTAIVREIGLRIVSGGLDSRQHLIHFLAQVRQEAGGNARLEENLNYSPRGLMATFRCFRNNPDEAQLYGRTESHPADPVAIADLACPNRNGSSDGWAYRGRGLFQLTGRANCRAFTEWHDSVFGEGIDFKVGPDQPADPRPAVKSAVYVWLDHGLSGLADGGLTDEVTDAITRRVNQHTNS